MLRIILKKDKIRNIDVAREMGISNELALQISKVLRGLGYVKKKTVIERTETSHMPIRVVYYEIRHQRRGKAMQLMEQLDWEGSNVS